MPRRRAKRRSTPTNGANQRQSDKAQGDNADSKLQRRIRGSLLTGDIQRLESPDR